MKASLDLIKYVAKTYSDIDIIQKPTEELIKLATERLGGVEGYTDFTDRYDKIVIVKVVSCVPHPNADKLKVCIIDDNGITRGVKRDKSGNVQVVCGAPNVKAGMLAVWIPPGASVPASFDEGEAFTIASKELRGVVSNGMLASAKELDLSDDHAGLLELDSERDEVKAGMLFNKINGVDDVIIDIENKMFTHRPDCFGQLGVARELAGIQGLAFKSPKWYLKPEKLPAPSGSLSIEVKNEIPELVPRYTAIVLENVKVGPSPLWLQIILKRLGVRSINNVVDITNLFMLETAQPLHAFDFDKITNGKKATIIVRTPKKGEKIALLDGKIIEPHNEAVLICNEAGPIALGGVMGGSNSEVDENTTRVVLECATFDMYNIRRTSMHHGLFTDAVTRFNKGQPPAQLLPVLHKAVSDFIRLTGATIASDVADSAPKVPKPKAVETTVDFINLRLGSNLTLDEIVTTLTNVELKVKVTADSIEITSPFWRTDLEIPEDIVEEVGRLHGFNNLPITLPNRDLTPTLPDNLLLLKQKLRTLLSRAGANEVLIYSFVHGNLLEKVGEDPKDAYQLRNALSPDLQYYRTTLTPSLLERIHPNIKAGFSEFALFEIGKVHTKTAGLTKEKVPIETNILALAYAAKNTNFNGSAYYMARRYLDFIADALNLNLEYVPLSDKDKDVISYFEPSRSALIKTPRSLALGIIGEYTSNVQQNLKLPAHSAGFELKLEQLLIATADKENSYQPLSKYPSSGQDITLQVKSSVNFAELQKVLQKTLNDTDFQWQLMPLGIFQKKSSDGKNISFHLELSSYERTLKTEDVSKVIKQLGEAAESAVGAKVI